VGCQASERELGGVYKKAGNGGNVEARRCNYCYRGRSIRITYIECVFANFSIQKAMSMRHTVICNLSDSTVFVYIIS
jgi:hypothetical protein